MAIPGPRGGMENWGLVMYGEDRLLYNPTVNSAANRQKVCTILSHELGHQVTYPLSQFYCLTCFITCFVKVQVKRKAVYN